MKKDIEYVVPVPKDVQVSIQAHDMIVKGPKGENMRKMFDPTVKISLSEKGVKFSAKGATKREKTKIGTFKAHLKNMIAGVQNPFIYNLKICSSHFHMNVSLSGNVLTVTKFLGEKIPRTLNIKEGAEVKVSGDQITVESVSKETAGQVAADIEGMTRITKRDRRVFQDGIYITEKAGHTR